MNKKPVYVKCPRCELNYIDKKEKLCNICKAEMNRPNSFYNNSDESDDNLLELCPYCKANYIPLDEEMCEKCASKETAEPVAEEEDENWRSFLDDETESVSLTTEDGIEISLSKLEEEELEKDFDEDDDYFKDDEDDEEFEDEAEDEELDELDEGFDDLDDDEDEEEDDE